MTATFEQTRRQASTLTTVITILALLLGWGLKMYVEGQTRPVSVRGITAEVPAGWIVRENDPASGVTPSDDPFQMDHPDSGTSPNLVFTAWNPLHPERHYSVSLYPGGENTTFPATASVRTLNRGSTLKLYRILEETPILVNGRDGYKVTFAYVDPGDASEVPTVLQGVDYYFAEGEQTFVVTLEVDNGTPADHLTTFLQFVETVEIGE
ncbi:MAG: hypothetical protein HUU38_31355 [Anaerolineales bacterium]|nr:hypothetical protein [Anaerolineales bacterium]